MRTLNIGRNATNNVILDDKMVSRQHAQLIILDNGQVVIKDLGSSNGTFVNGNKITEYNLKAGDIVKCGNSFVKWTQYINERSSLDSPIIENNEVVSPWKNLDVNDSEDQSYTEQRFSFGETLRYLTTKIFNIDDIFQTNWNKTSSILFFLLSPLVITLLASFSLYFYFRSNQENLIPNSFSFLVMLPFIVVIFIFGVSQFLSLSLLSINRDTTFNKNVFASSIFSFLQFLILIIMSLFLIPALSGSGFDNLGFSQLLMSYYVILYLAIITIMISLEITIVTFIYKYFRAIGVSNGISIHLTILAFTINLLFQSTFSFFISMTVKSMLNIPKF